MARRQYRGAAETLHTSGSVASSGAVTITTAEVPSAGWPTGGANGQFLIAIDRGTASEEKILVDSRTGNSFTVSTLGRGADGTTAKAHANGAVLEHVMGALDLDEPNAHVNDATVHGGLITTHEAAGDPHPVYLTAAEHTADPHTAAAAVAAVPSVSLEAFGEALAHNTAVVIGWDTEIWDSSLDLWTTGTNITLKRAGIWDIKALVAMPTGVVYNSVLLELRQDGTPVGRQSGLDQFGSGGFTALTPYLSVGATVRTLDTNDVLTLAVRQHNTTAVSVNMASAAIVATWIGALT